MSNTTAQEEGREMRHKLLRDLERFFTEHLFLGKDAKQADALLERLRDAINCTVYDGVPGGECTRCGMIRYEHEREQ